MKSRLPLLDLKGSIALLILAIGTAAFALIPESLQKTTTASAPTEAGRAVKFSTGHKRGTKLPLFGLFLDASVTTDRQDYSPGDVVYITGSGFYPNEAVSLQVTYVTTFAKTDTAVGLADASGHDPWTVTADQNGNISSSWLVESDSLGQTLLLTAVGQSSGLRATHTFTDSVPNDFQQCANAAGGSIPNGQCSWLNGILQQNNSNYFEGMSTLQRSILKQVTTQPGNNHILTFDDDWTKGGIHAYDFLTSWEQGIRAGTDSGVPYVGLTTFVPNVGESASNNQTLSVAVACDESISATGQTICDARHNQAYRIDVPAPDDSYVSHTGNAQDKINAYEAKYGNRYVRIYGDAPFTSASFDAPAHDVANGADTADSGTTYTLHWQSASTVVLIEWGEHIASGADGIVPNGGWGTGNGASSISGGPYHVGMVNLDGATIGSQDNQLKGADVKPPPPQGSITIIKDAIPNDAQDFAFTTTGGLSPSTFSLDDDGDPTLPNSQQYSGLANGTYTVTETGGVAGWNLVEIACTDPNGGTTWSVGTRTASINLSAGEAVTCTFTNVKPDAKIAISPGTATNEVGDAHTITATVTQDDMLPAGAPGDGSTGFGPAPDGTQVTFSLTGGSASFVGGVNTCTTSGGTGTCTVQINSSSAGTTTIHATTTFSVAGVSLTRATGDGLSGDSPNATKTYVDAKISLSPNTATNEVNHAHTITATVQQDDGIAAPGGDNHNGFGPAPDGTTVTFSITSGSATFVGGVNTCTTVGGSCSVNINSSGAGSNTIHATTTFFVGGLSLTRATGDGISGDGGNVSKVYVDGRIVLSPLTATNNVNQPHTITATVSQDDGIAAPGGDNVNGFGPVPNGTLVTFSLTNSLGATATFVGGVNTCTTSGGACSVQINSPTAGHVVIHATTTFSVGGVSLTRASGDGLSGDSVDAQKDYVAGSLTLVKRIVNDNGGIAVVGAFGITTNAGSLSFGAGAPDGTNTLKYTSNTLSNLAPGTYSLHEGTLTGYSEGTWGCIGAAGTVVGDPQTGSVVLAANENVTCTITNNDNPPSLTLDKIVTNTNGGTAPESSWNLTATGTGGSPTNLSGPGAAGHTDVQSGAGFKADTYTLAESGSVPGYTNGTTYSCVKTPAGGSPGAPVVSNTITLANGDSAVCTITNHDNPASLQLVKALNFTHGGTRLATDWTTSASGPTPISGAGGVGPSAVGAGTYTLSETGTFAGYTNGTTYSCVKTPAGGTAGAPVSSNSITLGVGDSAVCTITNSDNPASLQLIKALNYTHGGTRPATDWTTSAAGATPISGAGGVGPSNVNAGTYTLSETGTFTGYTNGTTYSCVKTPAGGSAGAPVSTNSISLSVGDSAVCTITNSDNPISLQLIKALNYTHGGTRPATDWTTSAAGPTPISGAGGVGPSSVLAGSYSLSETGTFAGYTNGTTYSCVKNGAAPVSSNSISLDVGDTAVCTITNSDNPASLQLIKALNYTHGGTRPASDWTTSAAGPTPISGAGGVGPSAVTAGAYTLSETGTFAGYTNGTTYSCVKTPAGGSAGAPVSSNSISLAVGDSAVCTITNSDNAPSLTLDKIVSNTNGGTAPESSWNLTATGTGGSPTNLSGPGAAGHTDVQSGAGFKADTYTLAESGSVPGYTNGTTYSCVTTPAGGSAGSPVSSNTIALAVGDSAICTITNHDNPASLQLVKALNYQFGGTRPATDWTTSAAGPTPISGAGGVGPSSVGAGTYTLSETGTFDGYLNGTTYSCVKTPAGGSPGAPVSSNSITLGVGDSAVCTITNSDIAPRLKVVKILVPSTDTGLFNLLIDGVAKATDVGNNGTTGFVTETAGSHTASETAGTNTSLSSYSSVIGGDCAADGTVTLVLGHDAVCTITNSRLPTLTIQKMIQGQSTQFEFTATGTPTNPTDGDIFLTPPTNGSIQSSTQIIQPGDYNVTEVNIPLSWLLTDGSCVSDQATGFVTSNVGLPLVTFTARYGDDVVCTFVDDQQGGATRTQGFWATHTFLSNAIWNGTPLPPGTSSIPAVPVIGSPDAKLCTANDITAIALPGQNQLMGGFWANVANLSVRTNKKRLDLDKARMQFLQQYLAAVLNVHAFGTAIPGTTLATARAAYCGTNIDDIRTQMGLLAFYNTMGDNQTFTPGASATPTESRLEANIGFWDITYRFADTTVGGSTPTKTDTTTTRSTTPTKSTTIFNNILILPTTTDEDQSTTDPDKPKKVKRPGIE